MRSTGHEKGTRLRLKPRDWAETLLGENERGSGSAVLRDPKVICQGRVTPKIKTAEERRQLQNQDRIRRRRRQKAKKLEEENERLRLAEQRGFARGVEAVCKRLA